MFSLAMQKDAMVSDLWNHFREGEGWAPTFLRPLNDWEMEEVASVLSFIHRKKIRPEIEDELLVKGSRLGNFSVRIMYNGLDSSVDLDFQSILSAVIPSRISFFAWEASCEKVMTLEQLKCHGRSLTNICCLCEEDEETIDHLLIHCKTARMIWVLFLMIVGTTWVFPHSVKHTLLAWQRAHVGKKRKKIWMASPLCLFWTLWRERNRVVFDNGVTNTQKIKANFLSNMWNWTNLYSVANTTSLVDFLAWLGCT